MIDKLGVFIPLLVQLVTGFSVTMRVFKTATSSFRCIFLLLAIALNSMSLTAEEFWIYDGKKLSMVTNSDPTAVPEVEEWQVWLYKRGVKKEPGAEWGIISAKSAARVMELLERDQKFEKSFCRFFGEPEDCETLTNFNPLGPIARTRPPRKMPQRILDKIEQVESARKTLNEAMGLLEQRPKENNPYSSVGRALKEYVGTLRDAAQRVRKATSTLTFPHGLVESSINDHLEDAVKNLSDVERSEQSVRRIISSISGGSNSGGGNWVAYDKSCYEGSCTTYDYLISDGLVKWREKWRETPAIVRDSASIADLNKTPSTYSNPIVGNFIVQFKCVGDKECVSYEASGNKGKKKYFQISFPSESDADRFIKAVLGSAR